MNSGLAHVLPIFRITVMRKPDIGTRIALQVRLTLTKMPASLDSVRFYFSSVMCTRDRPELGRYPCLIVAASGLGMKLWAMVKLIGTDANVCTHEIGGGTADEYSPRHCHVGSCRTARSHVQTVSVGHATCGAHVSCCQMLKDLVRISRCRPTNRIEVARVIVSDALIASSKGP
jgi:hypothetical protein